MAIARRHLIPCLLVSLVCAGFIRAEYTTAPTPQVELRFTVFGISAFQGIAYLPKAEAKPVELKFYNNYRSPSYAYEGSPSLEFYDTAELAAAQAEAKPTYPGGPIPPLKIKPVARCTISADIEKAFLLFFPKAAVSADGIKYEVFAMNDGATNIPAGSFIIINASRLEFAAKINSETVTIGRGVSAPFKAEKGRVSLRLSRMETGYENLTLGDQWRLDEKHRNIVVLFPITQSGNLLPDSRRLTDQLPAEPKKERVSKQLDEARP